MKQRIEQFWTEAESLLNSDKKLIDKISEIENLIRERLERFELINYDAEFNLVKESGIENLANQQKEKIIKNIWNPLFNEASTFQEYSYLLNWVIPVNKWYSFCGDYEILRKKREIIFHIFSRDLTNCAYIRNKIENKLCQRMCLTFLWEHWVAVIQSSTKIQHSVLFLLYITKT